MGIIRGFNKLEMEAALRSYREAVRCYRVLFREMPWQAKRTFLTLTEHLRRTGRWPDMASMAEASPFTRATILRHLRILEHWGLLNLEACQVSFPIVRLNQFQEDVYWALAEDCCNRGETTGTLVNALEYYRENVAPCGEEEAERCLGTLKSKKLIKIQVNQTNCGKGLLYRLLPSPELAELQVFREWRGKPWVNFFAITNG